jgi:hypothetical protein
MEVTQEDVYAICSDWIRLLTLVLEWPENKAVEWANGPGRELMKNPFFTHETVSYHIMPLIITNEVRQQTVAMGELRSRLDLALERFRRETETSVRPEQVTAIRREIRDIIESCTRPVQK